MFKPRWILVLLAIFVAAVLVDFTRRTANAKPRTMLEAGRAALEGEEPDFDGALLHLERGITLARAQDDPDALQDLLRAYAATYLGRWERGVTSPDQAAIESDLDEVLRICQSCVLEFGPEDPDLLRMGARAAFDAGRPALAISFLQQLFDLVPATPELDLLFGRAQLAAVEQTLASLTDRLIKVEPEADPTLLEETLRRAITLPFADPRRAAEIEKLSRDLPAIHRRPLLAKLETGSRSLQRATAAFQKVLDREPNGKAVVGLLRILLLADSVDRAAELVAIGLETPGLTDRQELVRTSLSAFLDLDRREQADRLCERFLGVDSDLLDPEVLLRSDRVAWCPLLLRLELWPALRAIAQSVLNEDWENHFSDEDTERTRFYYAIALSHVGSASAARPQLLRTDPKGRELYPGMRMEWAEALGRCDLKLQDERSAHHDLLVATNAIPREGLSPRLARVAGHAWKAYGELLASDRDYLRAEDALTRALELLPKERRRIEPTWRSVGEAALRKRGRTLGFLERSPLERTPAGGFPPMGAFEACTRARLGLERGLVGAIPLLLQPILDSYPRLPLALELLARTEMLRGRFDRAIDAELALLEAGQRSEAGLELLRSIPETAFTGSQRRRWILHDPVAAGWTAIVEELARSGDHRGLRSMLEHTDRGALRPTQLLRAARIAAEDGATSQALSLLAALPDSSPERAAGIGLELALSIRLAQRTHSPAPLRQCLGRPFPKDPTPPLAESPQLLSAIAWALADGDGGLVRPILQASAEQRSDARGEALLLLSLLEAVEADRDAATEALDRAEPWLAQEDVQLVRLFFAIEDGDTASTADLARELALASTETPPLRRTILALLSADSALLADAPRPADLPAQDLVADLLREAAAGGVSSEAALPGTDRALSLALILASERSPFAGWAAARLAKLSADARSSPLGLWIQVRAWRALGRDDIAQRTLRIATARFDLPTFFLELEAVLRDAVAAAPPAARGPETRALYQALAEHVARLGPDGVSAEELALLAVHQALEADGREAALRTADEERQRVPDSLPLRIEAARLAAGTGRRIDALARYESALLDSPDTPLEHLIPEIVELVGAARAAGELTPAATAAVWDALRARFPEDPTPARVLAEWTLACPEVRPEWAVRRSWDILDRFRARSPGGSIESQRAGEAKPWFDLILPFDPDRAERFVRTELDEHLGSALLWGLWCDALARSGRTREALATYDAVLQLLPTSDLERGRALLRLDVGLPVPEILKASLDPEQEAESDPELVARCAAALARGRGAPAERALAVATDLWGRRGELAIPAVPLGRELARALAPTDPEGAAAILEEAAAQTRQPLELTLLRAARSLILSRSRAAG